MPSGVRISGGLVVVGPVGSADGGMVGGVRAVSVGSIAAIWAFSPEV
jgi:hypothetical protein